MQLLILETYRWYTVTISSWIAKLIPIGFPMMHNFWVCDSVLFGSGVEQVE